MPAWKHRPPIKRNMLGEQLCSHCSGHPSRVGPLSRRGICMPCALAAARDAALQLSAKSGPRYARYLETRVYDRDEQGRFLPRLREYHPIASPSSDAAAPPAVPARSRRYEILPDTADVDITHAPR